MENLTAEENLTYVSIDWREIRSLLKMVPIKWILVNIYWIIFYLGTNGTHILIPTDEQKPVVIRREARVFLGPEPLWIYPVLAGSIICLRYPFLTTVLNILKQFLITYLLYKNIAYLYYIYYHRLFYSMKQFYSV